MTLPTSTVRSGLLAGPLPSFLLLYTSLYAAYGTESAYFPAFLGSHSVPTEKIGLILAAGTVVRMFAGPAAGRLADHLQARKHVLAAAAAGAGLIGSAYLGAFGFWPLLAVGMAHAAATAPLAPLSDALSVAASAGGRAFQYGWVRGVGSAAFVAGTLLSGQLVDQFGLWCIIAASSALFIAMAACAARVEAPFDKDTPETGSSAEAFRALWQIAVYRRLLLVAALVIGSQAMKDAFAVIAWREAGYGSAVISLLWSESVAAEVVVFLVLGPWLLKRLGPARAAALAAGAGVIRWAVLGWTVSAPALMAVQALHGLMFALLHLAAMDIMARHVPDRLSATAQTVYNTLALGVASALLTIASGYLYAWYGLRAFWVMALLCAAALPLVAGLHQKPSSDGTQAGAANGSPMA